MYIFIVGSDRGVMFAAWQPFLTELSKSPASITQSNKRWESHNEAGAYIRFVTN